MIILFPSPSPSPSLPEEEAITNSALDREQLPILLLCNLCRTAKTVCTSSKLIRFLTHCSLTFWVVVMVFPKNAVVAERN
jgi:hypothetical protein